MKVLKLVFAVAWVGFALGLNATDSIAQQVTGVLGSPKPPPRSTASNFRRLIRISAG